MQVLFHHRGVHAEYATGHGVAGVGDFQFGAFKDHLRGFFLKGFCPQVGVFQFDLVDDVDTKIEVHGFVTQNVLKLLGDAGHFIAAAHGENLAETAVKEDAFGDAAKSDKVAE